MDNLITEIIKVSPYLGFVLMYMVFEARREDKRTENAKALEDRREAHDIALEEKREEHDREMNNMWANSIKMIVESIQSSNKALMDALAAHDKASEERYEKIGNTKELMKAVQERGRK